MLAIERSEPVCAVMLSNGATLPTVLRRSKQRALIDCVHKFEDFNY
jgi:hypothetical protein